jgi:type IV pilus assembly protein PilW
VSTPITLRRARQHGMTIAELLVSMALGLAVLLAAGALLVSANQAYVAQADSAAADDGGRFALELIGRALRQAAYVDWERDWARIAAGAGQHNVQPAGLAGLDDRSISKAADGIANPLPDAVNGSDVLAVRFGGAGPAPDGDGSVASCAGFPVHGQADGWSIFYVARNGQGEPELRCKYRGASGWGADAVVAGVDGFQVLYGVDTDAAPDGVANRYVNASAIAALDAAIAPGDRPRRSHWKRIVSVKVALLLRGAKAGQGARASATYDLFGRMYGDAQGGVDRGTRLAEAELAAAAPARERRLFATTFVLRGPAPGLAPGLAPGIAPGLE